MTHKLGWRGSAVLALLGLAAVAATPLAGADTYWPPITDHATDQRNTGRFVWAELLTRDVGAAAEFYGKVFGWTFETYGPADDLKTYTVVLSAERRSAAWCTRVPRTMARRSAARAGLA